jgi:hypothetical protein
MALGAAVIVLIAGGGTFLLDRWMDKPSGPTRDPSATRPTRPPDQWLSTSKDFVLFQQFWQKAPGTEATALELQGVRSDESFSLARYRGVKPVVLLFGSLSCDRLHTRLADLEKLYQEYTDRVAFAFINVREAGHEIPQFEFLVNDTLHGGRQHNGLSSRKNVEKALGLARLSLPAFMDSPSLVAEREYWAYPARLVVVAADGRIARDFGSVFRPWDMKEVGELLDALYQRALGVQPQPKTLGH